MSLDKLLTVLFLLELIKDPTKIEKSEVPKTPVDVLDIGSGLAESLVQLNKLVQTATGARLGQGED